ncbi:MAG: AMP-binding protein, partial [Nitrosomonas sp.]|nr:AMP-binding protein [Nitrosomonas sp.]
VYHSDAVEFLSIVLTLWHLGKIPVIPANNLSTTLQSIKLETDCFVGEFDECTNLRVGKLNKKTASVDASTPQQKALIMFTSGSSGSPVAIVKTFDQLNAELKMLEAHWGAHLKQSVAVSTVSYHHMYGLPFYLLWPLVAGRAFLNQNLIYLEQLLAIQNLNMTVISSPAHLEHMPDTLDWCRLRQSIRAIFSAGALLSESVVKDCQKKMGVVVTEIYGSTETGAVAYRDQSVTTQWRPLSGISVKECDGKLAINSPAAIAGDWYVTEDLCKMDVQNQFSLLGRADKIIKVGGKRISITALESRLSEHVWVKNVRIIFLKNRKNRFGAVVQLTVEGSARLVDQGKLVMNRELGRSLEDYVEKIAWPRYWRYVSQMPINQQGKTTAQALAALFDNAIRPRLPQILEKTADQATGKYVVEFIVPHDLFYLEGHFPGKPILPGVVQVGWVVHYFQELYGDAGDFLRLEALKFQQVIQPGEKICLSMMWDATKERLTFYYTGSDCLRASGRVVFTRRN